jgi:hypothetical protein
VFILAVALLVALLALVAPGAGAAAPQPGLAMSYSDATGDATGGVTDILSVSVEDDADGDITFTTRLAGAVATDMYVDLWVDADRSPRTGTAGVEFNVFLDGRDERTYAQRWNGSEWVGWAPPTGEATYRDDVWTLTINRSDFRRTAHFDFYFVSTRRTGSLEVGRDRAPNGNSGYTYRLANAPAPPPTPSPPARTFRDAPSLPRRAAFAGASIEHARLGRSLDRATRRLRVPRAVAVACWSRADWPSVARSAGLGAASASFWLPRQPRWLHVGPAPCGDVQALMSSRKAKARHAQALARVMHERVQAEGVGREAQAECYGVQLVYEFARGLGLAHAPALRLEELAVRSARRGSWDARRCRDGGAWDLYRGFTNLT